jgi:hypothetical protein
MYKYVQGRVDAIRKWGEHVEEMIFNKLGLLPNQANPAVYSGIFKGPAVILGQHLKGVFHASPDYFAPKY